MITKLPIKFRKALAPEATALSLAKTVLRLHMPILYQRYKEHVDSFAEKVLFQRLHSGRVRCIRWVKNSRIAVTRCLSGAPLKTIDQVRLVKGWPYWLLDFKPLIEDPDGVRFLLTLLSALRGVHTVPVLDLDPIVTPSKGVIPEMTPMEFARIARWLGLKPMVAEWKASHFTCSAGPAGQAILSALCELDLLDSTLLADINLLGGEALQLRIARLKASEIKVAGESHALTKLWSQAYPLKGTSLRKLSYFADREGKTRVVAILDYWSQTALKPYHQALTGLLKRIENDCTFDQGKFRSLLPTGPYHSIDLSNATDRMPLILQRKLMSHLFGEAKASAWARVLVDREYVTSTGHRVKYAAGQPMGAYSSWPAMALTHHFIVKLAGLRAGISNFKAYALLGDDLVIASDVVAKHYREILAILDMPVAEAKTHASIDTYEFAKRWIWRGHEVTPYSVAGLKSVYKRFALLSNYLQTQADHGWRLGTEQLCEYVRALYRACGSRWSAKRIDRYVRLMQVLESLADAKIREDFSAVAMLLGSQVPTNLSGSLHALSVDASRRLLEQDVHRLRKDRERVLKEHYSRFRVNGAGLPLTGILRLSDVHIPVWEVFERLAREATQALASSDEPDPDSDYVRTGASRYHLATGVFHIEPHVARVLDAGRWAKSFLTVLRIWEKAGRPDLAKLDPYLEANEVRSLIDAPPGAQQLWSLTIGGFRVMLGAPQ